MLPESLRKSLNVVPRILSEADGTVEYIASDHTLDSYDEVVMVNGWRFDFFAKNAPFVNSHNYWSIEDCLGRVDSARIEGNQLIERVTWAKDIEEHKLAKLGWKMTVGGFLKAVSVGFRVIRQTFPGGQGWGDAVTAAGLDPDMAGKCRRIFLEQQQLELSACIIGANPSAVAKAYQAKCIGDGDLASVGFDDDDLHFLSIAGPAADKADLDPITRALICREMSRITDRRKKTPSSSPPSKPDGGEELQRQAAERADFLRQFEALVKN
jgi:hypothetical protein